MQVSNIISTRFFEDRPSYQIIYEWEDVLANQLSVPIINAKPLLRKVFINRYTKRGSDFLGPHVFSCINNLVETSANSSYLKKSLVFDLYVSTEPSFSTSPKAIPILIDFWKQTDLTSFYQMYRYCPLVLISSLEVFNYLRDHKCPLNIAHFPLSLSDKYRLDSNVRYTKSYDVLFAGRSNPVLMKYIEIFVAKFPNVEYLHQKSINGKLCYISNKRGNIGNFETRDQYMNILKASRISFYSTPGIDGGEKRSGGFNPVTPRFLELLSAQCLLLGRYPKNEETDFYELDKVCPNIESYDEFETILLGYLNQRDSSFDLHREVLEKHYTSRRAQELLKLLGQSSLY